MPFRSIIANPDDIAMMTVALEDAWGEIQRLKPIDPLSVAGERERLGYIIAGLWEQGLRSDLARQAVERIFATGVTSASLAEFIKARDL